MMPSYQTPSSSTRNVRLSSPQPAHQNSPTQPQHQTPNQSKQLQHADQAKNAAKSPGKPQRLLATALDRQFVATGLESFQSDPPPSDHQQLGDEQPPNHAAVDNDEESQQQPLSGSSSLSPLSSSNNLSQAPASAAIFDRQISYTNSDNNYQAYGGISWDTAINSNNSDMLNDNTHHVSNRVGAQGGEITQPPHRHSATSNTSSIGMMSPRMEMDITDLETPRAGLTRRTVDVMIQGATPLAKNSLLALQSRQDPSKAEGAAVNSNNLNDPFYSLRLPSTTSMGMTPPQPKRQSANHSGLNVPFAHAPHEFSLPVVNNPSDAIPLLPKLDATGAIAGGDAGQRNIAAPRSISVDALRLHQMEFGSAPHWEVRDPSPAHILKPQVQITPRNDKAVLLLGSSSDLFANTSLSSGSEYKDDAAVESNAPRNGIKHIRLNLTQDTDAASSLQSSIKFQELKLQEVIGGGGFGQVWRALWRDTPVAVKVLTGSAQAKNVSKAILEEFAAEINLLSVSTLPVVEIRLSRSMTRKPQSLLLLLAGHAPPKYMSVYGCLC